MHRLTQLWYRKSFHGLTLFLRPVSWLYRFIIAFRLWAYKYKIFKVYDFPIPIIVVGNITVGGTGKTPLVIWLVNWLKTKGYRPATVSRGYKCKTKQFPQWVKHNSDPKLVGDEPLLIAKQTQCPVVIDPDRVAAVDYITHHTDCNIVVSDDGLQHYALGRDCEIVVVDSDRQYGNRLCLPAGPLREPLSRLDKVDFEILNGHSDNAKYHFQLQASPFYNLVDSTRKVSVDYFQGKTVHAVAAIGYPQRFFQQLMDWGIKIIPHSFPDHYSFTAQDLDFGDELDVIMTEKDAVKYYEFANKRSWVLPVMAKPNADFIDALDDYLGVFCHSN